MNGAGNDFVVFNLNEIDANLFSPDAVKKICDRKFGIGADGVICIGKSEKYDFDMKYFNADGHEGSLCGNGARCALYFASDEKIFSGNSATFSVKDSIYNGNIKGEKSVEFFLNSPGKMKFNFKLKAATQLITAHYVDTGSPHVVIFIDDVLQAPNNLKSFYSDMNIFPVENLGKEIRYHKDFSPAGTNVNFIQEEDGLIKIRTYERGVEAETLACGTGSVAAAITALNVLNLQPPIQIKTLSGKILTVNFIGKDFTNISLTGHVEINFKGEILINDYFN